MLDNNKCWLKNQCNKIDCDKFCLKHFKFDYLYNQANISLSQRKHIDLVIDDDGSDLEMFQQLSKISENIVEFINNGNNLYIHSIQCGNGKAQPDSSNILTSTGFKKMKDIAIGEEIFGEDGKLHRVIGKFDRGIKPIYKITFNDRTFCECCDEHLWNISDRNSRNKSFKTLSLKELLSKDLHRYKNKGYRYQIPVAAPLIFNKKEFILHPYILGYILGDGHTNNNGPISLTIQSKDSLEVSKIIDDLLPTNYYLKSAGNPNTPYAYIITSKHLGFGRCKNTQDTNIIKEELRKYHIIDRLSPEKEIPSDYLFSDINSRIALFQGLMDTDGTVLKNTNNLSYGTTSKKLAEQFAFLVQSLGGTVTISEKSGRYYKYKGQYIPCKTFFYCQVKIPSEIQPFRLTRKLERFANNQQVEPYRAIHKIEYVGEKHCYCIMTDNPTQLYLTDNCIVTHNTSWALRLTQSYLNKIWFKCELSCKVLFINVPRFLLELKNNISEKNEYITHIKENVLLADLVIWDEIGSKGLTQFEHENVLNYINARIDMGKSNIYTSNLNELDLHQAVGDRLYSRIVNNSINIELKGKDKRSLNYE